jgi:hypothetical protein
MLSKHSSTEPHPSPTTWALVLYHRSIIKIARIFIFILKRYSCLFQSVATKSHKQHVRMPFFLIPTSALFSIFKKIFVNFEKIPCCFLKFTFSYFMVKLTKCLFLLAVSFYLLYIAFYCVLLIFFF